VLAGLARNLNTANSRALAGHLLQPLSRPMVRHMLKDKPVGPSPTVYVGQADGVTLQVVGALSR
jgi:urea transport system substrate-binding protein